MTNDTPTTTTTAAAAATDKNNKHEKSKETISFPLHLLPPLDEEPMTRMGTAANLEDVRQYLSSPPPLSSSVDTKDDDKQNERNKENNKNEEEEEEEEELMLSISPIKATLVNPTPQVLLGHDSSSQEYKNQEGKLFITTRRLFFLSSIQKFDVCMDARCIALHALSSTTEDDDVGEEGKQQCVYLQLCGNSDKEDFQHGGNHDEEEEGNCGPTELFLTPTSKNSEKEKEKECKALFDALTKLADLNPIHDDSDTGGGLFGMMAMMAGQQPGGGGIVGFGLEGQEEEEEEDDMICRIDPSALQNSSSEGATEEEREKMLNRLDDLLVVPPQYEIKDGDGDDGGQFDDAEEEEEEVEQQAAKKTKGNDEEEGTKDNDGEDDVDKLL